MKIFQNLIYQLKDIIEYEFGIMDGSGLVLASSNADEIGSVLNVAETVLDSRENIIEIEGITYQKVFVKGKIEYITFIKAALEKVSKLLSLFSVNVINIKSYHEDKFDKTNFIKEILTNKAVLNEIPLRAKELHVAYNISRSVFLIKTEKGKDVQTVEILQSLFPNRARDYVIAMDDESTVLVRELKSKEDPADTEKVARSIVDTLNTELMVKACLGIGTTADNLRELGRAMNEAQVAIEVGSIFENDSRIARYDKLGLGRLIYKLHPSLCRLFLKEVFKEGSFELLDDETIMTIQKFFENNLNVSETSRQLYVHRNTLVYRLDKIQKITGLDLRQFDDAIVFKVSMLVSKYLSKKTKLS